MTAQLKTKLDTLRSEGKAQLIYGVIGCCKNYYVMFSNDTQKYLYNPNKPISRKLSNKLLNYVYTNTNMEAAEPAPPQPTGRRLTVKTKPSETNYGKIHHKAVNKIIHMLGRTIKMKVTKSTPALKKNTHTIEVQPKYVGKNQDAHIEALLDKAFTEAKKLIKHKNYKVYTYLHFPSQQGGDDFEVRSNTFDKADSYRMLGDVIYKARELLQSDHEVKLKNFQVSFNFIGIPEGGARSVCRDKLSILNKKSVNKVTNDDNNCFWYALTMQVYAKHKSIASIKAGRPIRTTLAMELCSHCGLEWNKPVSFDEIPKIEKKLDARILILDMEKVPMLNSTIGIYETLMYKNDEIKSKQQFWLLHDDDHYHAINNIKGFLAIEYFCSECLHGFHNKKAFEKHECCQECCLSNRKQKQIKSSKIGKDLTHYLHQQSMKGGKDEVEQKLKLELDKLKEEGSAEGQEPEFIDLRRSIHTNAVEKHRYVIYDFEADVHTLTHMPNHVEADVLQVDENRYTYEDCLTNTFRHNGYDAVEKFCDWLFTKDNYNSTVIAHNQAGYDGRFILQYCLNRGLHPTQYIRQGSRIMYMAFKKHRLRFVDSLHFFLEPLHKLSSTYSIDTVKGFFPHHFNRPENQNYVGEMPEEEMYGVRNMDADTYKKKFKPWYDEVKTNSNWDFKHEMTKYCRADVELLSKSVLKFRKMFKDKLDIDPFRYVTLASLCMAIFRGCFLPDKSIVANEQNKPISKTCKEWMIYMNDDNLIPEVPIKIDRANFDNDTYSKAIHCGKCNNDETIYYKYDKHLFTVDACDRPNKIIKEFNGCYFHGCPTCFPECKTKYNKTMERKNLLELAGYKVETMWGCEWDNIKKKLPNKSIIEDQARKQNIRTRDALMGGRTEAFKSYFKCNKHQKIFYLDVCSLYPTVNALDDYAVGYKKYVNITSEDILNDKFIGVVKCDIKPPKDLHIPVLPDNSDGKLLFHLNDMYEKTWASPELKLALQKGYEITKIHSAVAYKRYNGLMKEYVGNFIKMKIENSGAKNQQECDKVNAYHNRLGFNFEIKPENTIDNPGLRQVAKICLNSLWGKFGQRCGMDEYEFVFDYNVLIRKFINNNKITDATWNIISEDCVELRYKENIDTFIESDYISELTAVFTTANARVRLYQMLDWLHPSQVCYCDTDSVIFIYDENNPEHKSPEKHKPDNFEFGGGLGQWEDEFDGKDYIEELVIGGAKSYSYKTKYGCTKKGKIQVKQKGITLDRANDEVVNFDTMRDMVLNGTGIESKKRFQFKWDTKTKDIITNNVSRSIKSTIKEKRIIDGYDTKPFGWGVN